MGKGFWDRVSGDHLEFKTPEDAFKARIARMRHIVWLGCKTIERIKAKDGGRVVMYTLTYAGVADWSPRHISGCMRWLRRQHVTNYVWVAELQKRGAVHYHVMALLPKGQRWRKPDADTGGWARGFTWVTDDVRYPLYIMKYLQKGKDYGDGRKFPKGLRLYAVSRCLVRQFEFEHAVTYRQCQLPAWFWQGASDGILVLGSKRVTGGVAVGRFTACTPYSVVALPSIDDVSTLMYANAWSYGIGCRR